MSEHIDAVRVPRHWVLARRGVYYSLVDHAFTTIASLLQHCPE